ncbi:DUF2474 domain-containing protein [Flexibacterium corallicola]|nr:DUF2474 domain-containing protein [Pseudovibrio sp. M1P-2-3]
MEDHQTPDQRPSTVKRLLWFAMLWLVGVGTITVISYSIRALIT